MQQLTLRTMSLLCQLVQMPACADASRTTAKQDVLAHCNRSMRSQAGTMALFVVLDGQPLAAAPITISAGAPSAEASRLLGPASPACVAGQDCWLVLAARYMPGCTCCCCCCAGACFWCMDRTIT